MVTDERGVIRQKGSGSAFLAYQVAWGEARRGRVTHAVPSEKAGWSSSSWEESGRR